METGYIGLFRQIRNWGWYTDTKVFKLFIHLLLSVNYVDKEWQGITINRGQIVTSFEKLADANGLSIQEVRTALNKLKKTKEIYVKTTNKYTLITVVNYSYYQDFDNMNNKQITNQQQTNNKPTTTTKERKERKERKEEREALAPFDFLKTNYKEEINNIIKDNRLNNVQLELCINKFNKRRVKNLNVLDFKNYIMNWSDNINKNNSQISSLQKFQKIG